MQINLNIEEIVTQSISAALAPERLQALIEKQVGEVADKAIKDVFSSYGDFSKTVSTAIKTLIPHELSLDGAASWNHAIGQHIAQRLQSVNDQRIAQALNPMLEKLLETPPAQVKVSELVAKAVEYWGEEYGERRDGKPTITIDKDTDGITGGYWNLYMDEVEGTRNYSCAIQLAINKSGEVYSLKVNEQDIKTVKFAGPFFSFEAYLFNLYTGGSKLVLDEEDFSDVCYPGNDD